MSDLSETESTPATSASPVRSRTPQLFLDEPDKTEEATSKFVVLSECTYTNKNVGSSGQHEYMTCDCEEHWDPESQSNLACGDDSNCINRFTSVECVNGQCGCGENCQNQRFQKKQYAPVSVFLTEKKGYGLRATEALTESSFIYEYIGEVIDEPTFRKRMIDYDTKHFKHFYFMMLKNDSFIDATVKGSLARFVNHSCNPNAYVDKWVVGGRLRMGIFAKRSIQKGEEITFDYNVDRYGAQSQPCYCGEPNCIKFMGGKTQTDAALLLPEGISEALGVTPQQEKQWLKQNKASRAKQQSEDSAINEKFIKELIVEPLKEPEVSKLMGALMKSQDSVIISKLIQRINLSKEDDINSAIIRFHGYKTFSTVIQQIKDEGNNGLMIMILEILNRWPKVFRNKISSSQIEDVIKDINATTKQIVIRKLSAKLLDEWSKLEMAYRIPKTNGGSGITDLSSYGRSGRSPDAESASTPSAATTVDDETLPLGWESAPDPTTGKTYYFHRELQKTQWDRPGAIPLGPKAVVKQLTPSRPYRQTSGNNNGNSNNGGTPSGQNLFREELAKEEEIKLKLQREAEFKKVQERQQKLDNLIEQTKRKLQLKKSSTSSSSSSTGRHHHSSNGGSHHQHASSDKPRSSSNPNNLENKWKHLFANYVPNLIRKKAGDLDRDDLKGCAKDIANKLAEKEISRGTRSNVPSELDKHKLKKIGEFVDAYMEKFLVRYNAKHKKRSHEDSPGDEEGDVKRTRD
ncbi:hypothetical protein DFJ63DRAFT_292236 [Scheffersomyces coipomensis]|uniref:uncharacterized protein n=1 Tax=Scheffersomyces coipomensis TaxID=1788519 RepID=UPI00315DD540